jgi:MFS transporter, DHA2 family, methylenomycin A resistance protein
MKTGIRWLILTTSLAWSVSQLDVTIVNVTLSTISDDLHTHIPALQWVVDAYTLVFAVFLIPSGALADRLGAKRGFLFGFLIFGIASVACAFAPTTVMLIFSRAFQGFGASLIGPSSLALVNHALAHDPALRAKAIGFWYAGAAIAMALGPIIGGVLTPMFGWRSIFLVNVPLCALGIFLALRFVGETKQAKHQGRLDLRGLLLSIVTLTGLTASIIETRTLGFSNPLLRIGFLVAFVGAIAFITVETRSKDPMIPLSFFSNRVFSSATLYGMLINFTYYGIIFLVSLYL